jgi:glyoxylase-like metal-dependent hydrolase (beta-lactamase superfamily II)
VYLAIDWAARKALWVDPASEIAPVRRALQDQQLELVGVVLTHSHHDHIAGLPALLAELPETRIYLHEAEAHRLKLPKETRLHFVDEGSRIPLGETSQLEVLHTPGHSAGELCLRYITPVETYLFTGDTLFIRECGRTDLPTGDDIELFRTLQRLKTFPPKTIILPGHHYAPECASRLEVELQTSPPLLAQTIEEFAALP